MKDYSKAPVAKNLPKGAKRATVAGDGIQKIDNVLRTTAVSDKFATGRIKSQEMSPARFLMLCSASKEFGKKEYALARYLACRAQKITSLGGRLRIQHPLMSSDTASEYITITHLCKLQKTTWWLECKLTSRNLYSNSQGPISSDF